MRKAWIASVVGYSILRAVLAWGFLREHGVNAWIFGVIDVGTAFPYASAIADIPGAIVNGDRSTLLRTTAIAVTTFLAPYAYLWFASDSAPTNLRAGLVLLVAVFAVAAGLGVVRKVRLERAETTEAPQPG